MKNYKKLFITMLTVVLTILAVSFLIYKYWKTSFPYGQYVDMSTITWQLVVFVFLDVGVLIINLGTLYFSWIKGDDEKWVRNYISLKVAFKRCLLVLLIAIIIAFIIPSVVFKFFMSAMIPASLIIFSGVGVELLMFKYYLKLS